MSERSSGFLSKAVCLILFFILFLSGTAFSLSLPFEEKFESDPVAFTIMPDTGWGVVDSRGKYNSFNNTRHLENCAEISANNGKFFSGICAETSNTISIPMTGKPPVLSFWYKSDLEENEHVSIEIHYQKRVCSWFRCRDEQVADRVRTFSSAGNTGPFHKWETISLAPYKGKDLRIVFRQSDIGGGSPARGIFVVDDFRIGNLPSGDADKDGIPNDYDPTPNNERLPAVAGIQAAHTGSPFVRLSWEVMEGQPTLAGYRVYRLDGDRKHDTLLTGNIIDPENTHFLDVQIRNGETYYYRIVAISKEGREGESPSEKSVTVNYNDPLVLPFEESFDSIAPDFEIPEASGWDVAESHGKWDSFSCNRRLDSNPNGNRLADPRDSETIRTLMKNRVQIPENARKPSLSFWYKSDLSGLSNSYFDDWRFWDYLVNWKFIYDLFTKNKVTVDIHYMDDNSGSGKGHGKGNHGNKNGQIKEGTDRYVRVFDAWPAVSKYTWESIPLHKYKGMDVCIMFRQESAAGSPPGMFVADDFRISDLPAGDANRNGVPDEYEQPMNRDMLPFVNDFSAQATDVGPVRISWTAIDSQVFPSLAGYEIYRRVEGTAEDPVKINTAPIAPDANVYMDNSIVNNTVYEYFMFAVSTGGAKGYPTRILAAEVAVPMPVIITHPSDITVQERQSVSLSIVAKGPGLIYQWQKNGTNISGADGSEYKIESAALEDDGSAFRCIVTNFAGSLTSEAATLTVNLAPPLVVKPPGNLTVIERDPAEFKIEYIGSQVGFQWKKNGEDIAGATASTYKIDNTPLSDNGAVLTCVVSNAAGSVICEPATLAVNLAPPLVVTPPQNLTVTERDLAEFTVEYIGSQVNFQWKKNGEDIAGATASTYRIENTPLTDNGAVLTCVVSNAAGSVICEPATLKVNLAPPLVVTSPQNLTVTERGPAEFAVQHIGSHVSFQWKKNGEDIAGATTSTYKIENVPLSDNGALFTCVVSNAAGSVTSGPATLTVELAPPLIVTHPYNLTVIERDPADFTIEHIGSQVSIQWLKNGEAIPGATASTCRIENTPLTDNGAVFACVVSNAAGNMTSEPATLTVNLAPPLVVTSPQSLTVTERNSTEFTIEFIGSQVSFQWKKNGEDIPSATAATYRMENTPLTDNGAVFTCVVSNAAGNVTSEPATLTVNLAPPLVVTPPQNLTVIERGPAEFAVQHIGSHVSFQWKKNGEDIAEATTSTYKIENVLLSDNDAVFTCVVSNAAGSVTSDPAVLTVNLAPPLVVTPPQSMTVTERDPVEFTIEYIGSHVSFQWRKNGEDIAVATASTFTVENTPLSDNGAIFTCVISNAAGSVTSEPATLTVNLAPPLITAPPLNLTVTERNSAEFKVEYIGSLLRFQWQKNDSDIPDATGSILKIPQTVYDTDNQARYRCVVSNDAGSVTSSEAVLTVIMIPPAITKHPESLTAGVRKPATFSVTVVGSSLTYHWQRFRGDIPYADKAVYTIDETEWSDNNTVYRCVVSNPAGTVASNEAKLTVEDKTAPELSVDGEKSKTTVIVTVTVSGKASDIGAGMGRVYIVSDRYNGREFAGVLDEKGLFTCQASLLPGENNLTVCAADKAGNQATANLQITFELPQLPILAITSPSPGQKISEDYVDVSGTVLSSLPPEQIKLTLNRELRFPEGANGEYTFTFNNVRLVSGPNTLVVTAATLYGDASGSVTVMQGTIQEEEETKTPPELAIKSFQPEINITGNSFTVSGMTTGAAGIVSVSVNGVEAKITGQGDTVSFDYLLENICEHAGPGGFPVEVKVTAADGGTTIRTFVIRCDGTGPQIAVDALTPWPAVNSVQENPCPIKGAVTEANLAGFLINSQNVGVLPQEANTYSFVAALPLVRGEETRVTIEAWDFAGNMTTRSYLLKFDAALAPEILRPANGVVITTGNDSVEVPVTVRAFGMAADDRVTLSLDGNTVIPLTVSGNTAAGALELPGASAPHKLNVTIKDASDTLLGSASAAFTIKNTNDIPLEVVKIEPENMSAGIEPASFIAYYFNRSIDPDLLKIEVFETVHGKAYEQQAKGADFTELNVVRLIDVHRDMKPVPGGLSHFPERTMSAFYPSREFAYGARIFANLKYNEEVIHRSTFDIRPLPTLIEGFVTDQFNTPLEGITVRLAEAGADSISNIEGHYEFGFGKSAGKMVPPGRYLAAYNPDRKNQRYGTIERWITVEEGRLNSLPTTIVPFLNPEEPFVHIASGKTAYLASGDLLIDFTGVDLLFADGRDNGDIQALFLTLYQISVPFSDIAVSPWVYSIQPQGVVVEGRISVDFALPARYGSHDYVAELSSLVLLVGREAKSMQIVPVGVGRVDKEHFRVTSVLPFVLDRLDYIGYAPLPEEAQPLLESYANGEMEISQLRGRLTSMAGE